MTCRRLQISPMQMPNICLPGSEISLHFHWESEKCGWVTRTDQPDTMGVVIFPQYHSKGVYWSRMKPDGSVYMWVIYISMFLYYLLIAILWKQSTTVCQYFPLNMCHQVICKEKSGRTETGPIMTFLEASQSWTTTWGKAVKCHTRDDLVLNARAKSFPNRGSCPWLVVLGA